jgi:hypothetical protein
VDCIVRPSIHFPTEGKLCRKESLSLRLYSRGRSANSGVPVIDGKSNSSGTEVKSGMADRSQLGIEGKRGRSKDAESEASAMVRVGDLY